jgi:hypothetical protein
MKYLLSLLLLIIAPCHASESRFGAFYFYQNDAVLTSKHVDLPDMARFSRNVQSAIWKILKPVRIKSSIGYLVIAVREDGDTAVWLDMEPAIHPYYAAAITQAIGKLRPFAVSDGAVVFGLQMSIDTPKFTLKSAPNPIEWRDAIKKWGDDDIDRLMWAVWPKPDE